MSLVTRAPENCPVAPAGHVKMMTERLNQLAIRLKSYSDNFDKHLDRLLGCCPEKEDKCMANPPNSGDLTQMQQAIETLEAIDVRIARSADRLGSI